MSNLIKSGFVAFSQNNTMVIDANDNKIIKGIEEAMQEAAAAQEETSMEDVLAEAMIQDAELDDFVADSLDDLERNDAGWNAKGRENAEQIVSQARSEAQQIVSQAHDEVEQLRAAAYDELEQIKSTARSDGYQAGYQEGLEAVTEEYRQKELELEEQIQQNQLEFEQAQETFVADMEQQMVNWLCQTVSKITGVMIDGQEDVLLYMVNEAIKNLDDCKHFVIKVSEEDYSLIEAKKEQLYGIANPNIDLELFADAKLAQKQCLIETENGVVNVSLDVQLANLQKALRLMIKE